MNGDRNNKPNETTTHGKRVVAAANTDILTNTAHLTFHDSLCRRINRLEYICIGARGFAPLVVGMWP